jgi:hypothetical protein
VWQFVAVPALSARIDWATAKKYTRNKASVIGSLGEVSMPTLDLAALVTFLGALSVASERLIEIVKGFVPSIDEKKDNVDDEAWRRATLHMLLQ